MLDDIDLDSGIKLAIYNLMLSLYDYGLEEIHMGGLMRLLGVPNDLASEHDDVVVVFSDDVARHIKDLVQSIDSSGHTLH